MTEQSSLEWVSRAGYAARGIVYALVAGLALLSSVAGGGPDSKSALKIVLEQPLGRIWLGLITAGLLGFIIWRLVQTFANADGHPNSLKGYAIRAGLLVSAATYSGLALYAAGKALGIGSGSGSSSEEHMSAWIIDQPFGRYLLAVLGTAVVGAGIAQAYKGFSRGYIRYLEVPATSGTAIDWICVYGLAARGAILAITGIFFLYAAYAVDPNQAGGLSDALAWVRQLPFGAILYLMTALGLLAFGVYSFIEARYRRIKPPAIALASAAARL